MDVSYSLVFEEDLEKSKLESSLRQEILNNVPNPADIKVNVSFEDEKSVGVKINSVNVEHNKPPYLGLLGKYSGNIMTSRFGDLLWGKTPSGGVYASKIIGALGKDCSENLKSYSKDF